MMVFGHSQKSREQRRLIEKSQKNTLTGYCEGFCNSKHLYSRDCVSKSATIASHLTSSLTHHKCSSSSIPDSCTTSTVSSTSQTDTISSQTVLKSIRSAWKYLSSFGVSSSTSPRLTHLERSFSSTSSTDPSNSSGVDSSFESRYTVCPSTSSIFSRSAINNLQPNLFGVGGGKKSHRSKPEHLISSRSSSVTHYLLRRRSKSKSEDALQTIGIRSFDQRSGLVLEPKRPRSHSQHCLNAVQLIGSSNISSHSDKVIFSHIQIPSISRFGKRKGVSTLSSNAENAWTNHRSRSLERSHFSRVQQQSHSPSQLSSSRSLERNYKFSVILPASSCVDRPPDHVAPPPPTGLFLQCSNSISSSPPNHPAPNIPHQRFCPTTKRRICGEVTTESSNCVSTSLNSLSSSPSNSLAPPLPSQQFHSSSKRALFGEVTTELSSSRLSPSPMKMDSQQGSSFINKPPRGWLHPDQQLAQEGVCYSVRYIGALDINTSMKSLNFDTRSLIAKECISKVCEAAGLKTADKKRKPTKSIGRVIGTHPKMENAGSDVTLTISSSALTLTTIDGRGCVIASHDMPNISFASGGDPDTLDFIAYVARDPRHGRACFVLECGGGLAQDVITTIGQAFELRFKEYLKRAPSAVQYINVQNTEDASKVEHFSDTHDREYYNDLPGKVPPEALVTTASTGSTNSVSVRGSSGANTLNNLNMEAPSGGGKGLFENLIDLSAPAGSSIPANINGQPHHLSAGITGGTIGANSNHCSTVPLSNSIHSSNTTSLPFAGLDSTVAASVTNSNLTSSKSPSHTTLPPSNYAMPHKGNSEPQYVNDAVIKQNQRDPFDMQPFSMQLNQMNRPSSDGICEVSVSNDSKLHPSNHNAIPPTQKPLPISQRLELQREPWFHGPISRKEAEVLLRKDGDFLVRESIATTGQYVLTGLQNGIKKHLLLVNPEGVVRTKSRTFDSVSHLISYHRDNELPIVSAESALLLRYPVPRNL